MIVRWHVKTVYLLCLLGVLLQSACSHIPGIRPDAAAELKLLAEGGDPRAQLLLARLLDEGAGVTRDLHAAANWYRQSAGRENPSACFELARLQLAGTIVPLDDTASVRLLFKAGEAGNSEAQALLGALYLVGRGTDEFANRAKLTRSRAEKGDASAQYRLGWMLRDGAGVPHSPAEARTWLTKAAQQGHAAAALLLGDMALNGEVDRKTPAAAVLWFEQSAAAGNRTAVARLTRLHDQGIVVKLPAPPAPLQRSDGEEGYRRLQLEFAAEKAATDQEAALLAARRVLDLDPLDSQARTLTEQLAGKGATELAPLFIKAEQQLSAGELPSFRQTLTEIISRHPAATALRDLNSRYWQRSEELFRKTEKEALEILRGLENFDTPESVRKNQPRIQKLTAAFHGTLEKLAREKPGDPRIPALMQKFERVSAAITRKRDERREEPKSKEEPVDSGDAVFKKGLSLLEGGQFDAAAKLFEKLARTPGYNNAAGAYIYLGIASLARINMAKVQEAKKLRLKGVASFQNALRFDRKAALPDGYLQYRDVFEEARRFLK